MKDTLLEKNAAETPREILFSVEDKNTVYDVCAQFSTEGKESLLAQLKKLILESA
ncbi:MAG: hypothetical protein IJI67_10555 [Clostridia bacterium]|nr:hypothetical protein [Clostridia bacterium]